MTGLALLLLSSAVAFALAQRFRLPPIPLLILLGFAMSRCGIEMDRAALNQVIDVGLAFLVFAAGIELNPSRFTGQTRAILWIGIVQFVVTAVLGYFLARAIGFDDAASLYLGVGLSTSSTLVAVRQLYRFPGSLRTYGRLVLGVLLVQDVVMIVFIVLLPRFAGGYGDLASGFAALAIMAVTATVCQRYLPRLMAKHGPPDEETMLLCTLGILFLFSGFSHWMNISFIAGGFAAGFALSGFPVSGEARGVISSLNTFFVALFFSALGAQVEHPDMDTFLKSLAFAAIVLIATPIVVTIFAEWKGHLSSRNAITAGLLLAQTSEFSIILAVYGERLGQISGETVSLIALVAVISMTLTPFLATDAVARRLLHLHPLRRLMKTDSQLSDHVVVLGYGSAGRWIIRPLVASGLRIVVIDQDPSVIAQLRKEGHTCIRGDASDKKVLLRAGADKARFILVSLHQVAEVVKVIEHVCSSVPVFARVFEEVSAAKVEASGGIPILNSIAAADRFMEWFERAMAAKKEATAGNEPAASP